MFPHLAILLARVLDEIRLRPGALFILVYRRPLWTAIDPPCQEKPSVRVVPGSRLAG